MFLVFERLYYMRKINTKISYKKEDIVEIMLVAEKFAIHVNKIEEKFIEEIKKLKIRIDRLQQEINELKK